MANSEVRDRVRRYLTEPVQPICDACIEHALRYQEKTVNPVCNEFKSEGSIARETGTRAVCGKQKLVNSHAQGSLN